MRDHDQSLWQQTCRERVESTVLTNTLTVDLAVIGGGYTGCAAALTAARAGASVCLLEAQEIGHGGSGRNVGLANAGLWLPPEDIRAHLGQRQGIA
ncbi:FAD-dependent oxidoreductase [Ruegeria sp. HKCCD7221]|uniref:FAD-dependent oxidoreductase n=1 Tax=unclassified Ruegeria TaxID=2625375 RepID=UPI0035300BDF